MDVQKTTSLLYIYIVYKYSILFYIPETTVLNLMVDLSIFVFVLYFVSYIHKFVSSIYFNCKPKNKYNLTKFKNSYFISCHVSKKFVLFYLYKSCLRVMFVSYRIYVSCLRFDGFRIQPKSINKTENDA